MLEVQVGGLRQEDAPTWLDLALPIHKEALLTGGAQKAHDFITDFVFLKAYSLSMALAPFEIDDFRWKEMIRRHIEAKLEFIRVIPIAWEAEAVIK